MIRFILLALIIIVLATATTGCSCGCNKTGPVIEENPQPIQADSTADKTTDPLNPSTNDCGCGRK